MLPVDVLELTIGRRRILCLKEHWIPLTSRRARLNGRAELFRELRRKTVRVLGVDKEACVRGICEGVEERSDQEPNVWSLRSCCLCKKLCT